MFVRWVTHFESHVSHIYASPDHTSAYKVAISTPALSVANPHISPRVSIAYPIATLRGLSIKGRVMTMEARPEPPHEKDLEDGKLD